MTSANREFLWRWSRIPSHGFGLSVDVHSPDLFELLDALEARERTNYFDNTISTPVS